MLKGVTDWDTLAELEIFVVIADPIVSLFDGLGPEWYIFENHLVDDDPY